MRASMRAGILALALVPAVHAGGAEPEWTSARPGYAWSFPEDHWSHPGYRSEWWYVTGHLESADDPTRRFGFQFTFFRVGLLAAPGPAEGSGWAATDLIMGHAAVADFANEDHRFGEVLHRAVPLLGGFNPYPVPAIAWCRGPAGTDRPWMLHWNGEAFDLAAADAASGFALRLRTRPRRPIVLHGEEGFSRKGTGPGAGASLYYSFTRLQAEGVVVLDGEEIPVRGRAWMDKEFSTSQLGPAQVGWDWFALRLDDGRDLMLYVLRGRDRAADFASGTLVSADGKARPLRAQEFSVTAVDTWRSEDTGAEYPSGWTVELPAEGLRLRVEPEMRSQENRARLAGNLAYWEGAVRVLDAAGRGAGEGFVELTGYAPEGGLGFIRGGE